MAALRSRGVRCLSAGSASDHQPHRELLINAAGSNQNQLGSAQMLGFVRKASASEKSLTSINSVVLVRLGSSLPSWITSDPHIKRNNGDNI